MNQKILRAKPYSGQSCQHPMSCTAPFIVQSVLCTHFPGSRPANYSTRKDCPQLKTLSSPNRSEDSAPRKLTLAPSLGMTNKGSDSNHSGCTSLRCPVSPFWNPGVCLDVCSAATLTATIFKLQPSHKKNFDLISLL